VVTQFTIENNYRRHVVNPVPSQISKANHLQASTGT